MSEKHPIIVFASGNGSTFDAIVRACKQVEVVALFSDQPLCYAVQRARDFGIEFVAYDRQALKRDELDESFADQADRFEPKLIVLAGYMRILGPKFLRRYPKTLNIHPSLLPKYKGLNTYKRVLASGEMIHGTTVHQVTEELDDGPIVAQESVFIREGDTVDTLRERTQEVERRLYPKIIDQIVTGSIGWMGERP